MHLHIFSFVECGHRVSKHVVTAGITVNFILQYNPMAVVSENYNKMLQ